MAFTAMNAISRNLGKALSFSANRKNIFGFTKPLANLIQDQQTTYGLARSLWILCNGTHHSPNILEGKWSKLCGCGCSTSGSLHTKGDKELVEFLEEEIKAELKIQKQSGLPKFENFDIKTSGGNVTLTKKFNNEVITIKLNVNHSVDTDTEDPSEMDMNQQQNKEQEFAEMKSKPSFTVDIAKGGRGLVLSCNFTSEENIPDQSEETINDVFQISELSLYEGELTDSTYAVSGEIMDGYLYDLLMNMLEDRGVSDNFAQKLIEFCTVYEHQQYIGLLQGLKSFVSTN